MSEFQWAIKTPTGGLLLTRWRKTDAIQHHFDAWGGAQHQGDRSAWWRRMKRRGWSVVRVAVKEVDSDE